LQVAVSIIECEVGWVDDDSRVQCSRQLELCIAVFICCISTVPAVTTVPEPDNVAESGEDSEDEWNYYRVEPSSEGNRESSQPVRIDCYLTVYLSFMHLFECCSEFIVFMTVIMCLLTMCYMFQATDSHCQVGLCVLQVEDCVVHRNC
jgi:hypothetical protein